MKKSVQVGLLCAICCLSISSYAVDCLFSLEDLTTGKVEAAYFDSQEQSQSLSGGAVEISGFKAAYQADRGQNSETLTVDSPRGSSVGSQYELGLLPKMTVRMTVDKESVALLTCIR